MFTMMNHARLNVGLEGVAVAEAAYQKAVAYARTRVQGKPIGSQKRATIIHHPDVRRMLMDMKARTEAMRALAYLTAAGIDRARRHPDPEERLRSMGRLEFLTPVVKGWSTETSIDIASTGIQVHGGMGYVEETGAAQYLRDARITTIYEGTTGIQALDLIGRKLVRDKGIQAAALIRDVAAEVAALAPSSDPDLLAIGAALKTGLRSFATATEWLLANGENYPREAAAGAVPYLKLTGVVAGGWQMARAARMARDLTQAGDGSVAFLNGKIATSRFYAEHVLPEAEAWRLEITAGAGSTMALAEASF
jgi:hypothetical protein